MRNLLNVRSATVAALFAVAAWSHVGAAQAQQFYSLTPCRAVDTRYGYGGIMSASVARSFTIKGTCGVPTDAKTVALNITIVGPTEGGFALLWPANTPVPPVSNINFNAGEPALGNGAVIPLAISVPDVSLIYGTGTGTGLTHVILDVTGYFK